MAPSMVKGQNVPLTKGRPGLRTVVFGMGWDPKRLPGQDFDLDASAVALDGNKQGVASHFVYFRQLMTPDGAIEHTGDNLTGHGDGVDEAIKVQLHLLPGWVQHVMFVASIYDAIGRGQTFGQVEKAFIVVIDGDTKEELARFNLTEDASVDNAMIFGELYRHEEGWKFRAVGVGTPSELPGLLREFGL